MTKKVNPSLHPKWPVITWFLLAVLLAQPLAALAETIEIPLGQQGNIIKVATPSRGMQQDLVIRQFGEPVKKSEAKGNPPIMRWEYNDFTVYFEGNHVIHSVLKHRPIHPVATDENNSSLQAD